MTADDRTKISRGAKWAFVFGLFLHFIYYSIWQIWHISLVNGVWLLIASLPWAIPYLHFWGEINALMGKHGRYWLDIIITSTGCSLNIALVYAVTAALYLRLKHQCEVSA